MQEAGKLPYRQRGMHHVWFREADLDALLQDPKNQRYLRDCRATKRTLSL